MQIGDRVSAAPVSVRLACSRLRSCAAPTLLPDHSLSTCLCAKLLLVTNLNAGRALTSGGVAAAGQHVILDPGAGSKPCMVDM